MEKVIKIMLLSILGLLLLIVMLLMIQNLSIQSVSDIKIEPVKRISAGEWQTCSTPSFRINCLEGLTCATIDDFKSDFNPNEKIGKCVETSLVNDLNSSIWRIN